MFYMHDQIFHWHKLNNRRHRQIIWNSKHFILHLKYNNYCIPMKSNLHTRSGCTFIKLLQYCMVEHFLLHNRHLYSAF